MKPSEKLKSIRTRVNSYEYPDHGICLTFSYASSENRVLVDEMNKLGISFDLWPLYSGDCEYPVSDPAGMHHIDAYHNLKKWNPDTRYGQARLSLLDWLIEQFEAKGA